MKKIVLAIVLALALLLVVIGCKAQGEHQADMPPEETAHVEETQPVATPEPEESNEPVNQVEKMSVNTQQEVDTPREATLMDLLELFQTVYDCRNDWISLGESEEVLELLELEEVTFQVEAKPDVIFPSDMQNRYLEWKAINYGTTEPVSAEQQQQTINTAGTTTTTTTQTGTTASTGDDGTAQLVSGDLGTDVTGGMSPMDFMNIDDGTEAKDSGGWLDMSKVGFGE